MTDLPKPAHRNERQAALGYINAAQSSLAIAVRRCDDPAIQRMIGHAAQQLTHVQERLSSQ